MASSDPQPVPPPLREEHPEWRREPYRLFFPLGILLGWAGVSKWLLLAAFGIGEYSSIFHSIAQIQGFMTCFALGFLFTAIPRRTGTPPAAAWEMVVGLLCPPAITLASGLGAHAFSQLFWLVTVVLVVTFAIRRFRSAEAHRRPPNGFVWIPLSFFMGLLGSGLMGAFGALGEGYFWLHELGKGVLLQGMFFGLIVGVGSLVLPLITRGEAPPDAGSTTTDQLTRAGHVAAFLLLLLSFWYENHGQPRFGFGLRAALATVLLVGVAGIHRPPSVPGWHRRLVWLSAWALPLGYLLSALYPGPLERQAGLHVVFVGGFSLMALSVALHVTLAHGGYERLVRGQPWQVPAFGGLLLLATAARVELTFDPGRTSAWMIIASGAFLTATLFWAWLALPRMRPRRPREETAGPKA